MRLRSLFFLGAVALICAMGLLGTCHWLQRDSLRGAALAIEELEADVDANRPFISLAPSGELTLPTSPDSSLAENPVFATSADRIALDENSAPMRVFVRAHQSGVELPGATVRVILRGLQENEVQITGDDGSAAFLIPLRASRVDLGIEAAGYVTAAVRAVDVESGEHIQDMIPAAAIEGFVQLDGAPSAVVHLWNNSTRAMQASTSERGLGEDQSFRFADLSPGGYALSLELTNRGVDFVANVEVGPGDTEIVHLRAPRPGELDLRVVYSGEDQEPVPGASVHLIPDRQGVPRAMETRLERRAGDTGEDGRLRVAGLSPGEWIVEAEHGAAQVRRRVEIEQGGRISEVRIVMSRAPSLIVRLDGAGGFESSQLYVFAQKPNDLNPSYKATPRPDGSFLFESLPPDLRLKIRAGVKIGDWAGKNETRPTRSSFVRLKVRDEPHELELELTAQCEATVIVKGPDGAPWRMGAQLGGQNATRFPEPGTYVFVLPAGPAFLEAGGEDFARTRERVVVKRGEANRFEVTLRPVSNVSGSFQEESGAALGRLRVRARRLDVEEGEKRDYTTRTNAMGEFQIDDLPAGEFVLSAITRYGQTGADSARVKFETPRDSGSFFPLVLPYVARKPATVGSILGRATTLDGDRVSRFRVQNLRGGTVSVDGERFEIRDLRSGRFNLTLVASGCLPQVLRGVELAAGATIDLGTIEFSPSTQVIVNVRGSDNKRLSDARIELRTRKADLEPGQKPKRYRIGDRRDDGRYQREKSPRGRFQLIVRRDGYETYSRNVTVREQRRQYFGMKLKKQNSGE